MTQMTKEAAKALLARHPDRVTNLLAAATDLAARKVDPATRSWVFAILDSTRPAVKRPQSLR